MNSVCVIRYNVSILSNRTNYNKEASIKMHHLTKKQDILIKDKTNNVNTLVLSTLFGCPDQLWQKD